RAGDLKRRFRHPCAASSSQRGRGFSNAARIGSDFSLTPPAHSLQPSPPLPPSPFAPRRSPHPPAKRFVQEAFRIGVAMRKALSIIYLSICSQSVGRGKGHVERMGNARSPRSTRRKLDQCPDSACSTR